MGTAQSSSRPGSKESSSSPSSLRYGSRNNSRSTLDSPLAQSHSASASPPPSRNNTSLHKALSRRRSSNPAGSSHGLSKNAESMSIHSTNSKTSSNNHNASNHHHYHSDSGALHSHQEEGDFDCRWVNGRRYHNTSSLYMLPNDTEEVDR
ncbi:hypothetical protein BGW38_007018 [Lunasporangiospora selenospora]|uniref:Uncharacterized protein n=1 Tax=Lunasporangiospora selenospora TaxID=979761 RepID=A0A9P6KAG7_9FUNG|nr:hypothetical protein BGW38_007018 [Lunasporangiospora selenospora]